MSEEIKKILIKIDYAIKNHIDNGYAVDMLVPLEFDVSQWETIKTYIEQLKKENKKLKEILENNSKINITDHKYASEIEDKYLTEHNILTEFENWLKYQIKRCEKETNPKQFTEHDIEITTNTMCRFQQCLDKLQELKEGRK